MRVDLPEDVNYVEVTGNYTVVHSVERSPSPIVYIQPGGIVKSDSSELLEDVDTNTELYLREDDQYTHSGEGHKLIIRRKSMGLEDTVRWLTDSPQILEQLPEIVELEDMITSTYLPVAQLFELYRRLVVLSGSVTFSKNLLESYGHRLDEKMTDILSIAVDDPDNELLDWLGYRVNFDTLNKLALHLGR